MHSIYKEIAELFKKLFLPIKESIKNEIKEELKTELKEIIKNELKDELKTELKEKEKKVIESVPKGYRLTYFKCWLCTGVNNVACKPFKTDRKFTIECSWCGVDNVVTIFPPKD